MRKMFWNKAKASMIYHMKMFLIFANNKDTQTLKTYVKIKE
jgi:hypothetical protein